MKNKCKEEVRGKKCVNCGAEKGLHHYEHPHACPMDGLEAPIGATQFWGETHFETDESFRTRPEAIIDAIKKSGIGDDVIIHNEDGSINSIVTVKCKEHVV